MTHSNFDATYDDEADYIAAREDELDEEQEIVDALYGDADTLDDELDHTCFLIGEVRDFEIDIENLPSASLTDRPQVCSECGAQSSNPEGVCYQCQYQLHAIRAFDMDGQGRVPR